MAKIVEDVLLIKFSKIVKDGDTDQHSITAPDLLAALEQVAQELVGDAVIVEVERVGQ